MSKPVGKCAFCNEPGLTKGHIWPESFGAFLPSDARYHEQRIGFFETFESNVPGPSKWERVGTGPLHKRRPRNTCASCNGGWMSRLESVTLPTARSLILGERFLIEPISIHFLAAILTLISMRIELTAHGMKTIPRSEMDLLRHTMMPSDNWRIWIGRYAGADLRDYKYRYTAMQIEVDATAPYGPEHCNTHVTTLVVGQFYVHILFSSVWPDFPGYDGIELSRIWPASGLYLDTGNLAAMSDDQAVMLHEAINRGSRMGGI
jgi:hypothetical protein